MSPATNLLIAFGLAAICAATFVVWKWLHAQRYSERVLIEDALKHLYTCEYEHLWGTIPSLVGALKIGRDTATRLAGRLEAMGLVDSDERGFHLKTEGRSYALRVIRIHRLWERYLADRTGVDEAEWHQQADVQEHKLTMEQADALSVRLGDPRFDPHGDPIPTAEGEIPSKRGVPLTALDPGTTARITHVEDEPEVVYAQLVAAGLYPGMTIQVVENDPRRIRIEAELEEHVLAPVVAANLTVETNGGSTGGRSSDSRLSSLRIGEQAMVVDISPACHGMERRRLLDLGIVPGTEVRAELESAGGDPVAYRIRGAVIALRKEQADLIYVRHEREQSLSG
jgi:DtxR family Mn-dependent transcriptional regulator